MATFIVTKKTMAKMGSGVSEARSAPVSDMARKAMLKMGWTEGAGLGKNSDGMASHIKVKKREESAGLGTETAAAEDGPKENWWMDALGAGLKAMNKKSSDKKRADKRKSKAEADEGGEEAHKDKKRRKERKEKKDKKDKGPQQAGNTPTFAELFAATGGARLGMRARAEQKGKLLRVEAADYDTNTAAALEKQIDASSEAAAAAKQAKEDAKKSRAERKAAEAEEVEELKKEKKKEKKEKKEKK